MPTAKKSSVKTKKPNKENKLNFSKKAISKTSVIVVALICGAFGAYVYFMSSAATAACTTNSVGQSLGFSDYYRMYKPATGDHFYTTSATERATAIKVHGYRDEGIAACVAKPKTSGTGNNTISLGCSGYPSGTGVSILPFYRLFSKSTGDHFYTTSSQEVKTATQVGYKNEGISACVASTTLSSNNSNSAGCSNVIVSLGGGAFHRMYKPATGDHFYTASSSERDNAIKKHGYKGEGVAACILNKSK